MQRGAGRAAAAGAAVLAPGGTLERVLWLTRWAGQSQSGRRTSTRVPCLSWHTRLLPDLSGLARFGGRCPGKVADAAAEATHATYGLLLARKDPGAEGPRQVLAAAVAARHAAHKQEGVCRRCGRPGRVCAWCETRRARTCEEQRSVEAAPAEALRAERGRAVLLPERSRDGLAVLHHLFTAPTHQRIGLASSHAHMFHW